MIRTIQLDQLSSVLRGKPCLVVGSSITTHATQKVIGADIERLVGNHLEVAQGKTLSDTLDALERSDLKKYLDCRREITSYISKLAPSTACLPLSVAPWSALISLAPDLCLEDEIRRHFNRQPSAWKMTLVTTAQTIPRRAQTLPIFKLLGNVRDSSRESTLALSSSELLLRKQMWKGMMKPLRDSVGDGVYLFIGTDSEREVVREMLSVLFADNPPFPTRLIFLAGDQNADDPVVASLASARSELVSVNGDWNAVVRLIKDATPLQISLALNDTGSEKGLHAQISAFSHLVSIPSVSIPTYRFQDRRQEIIDSLFSPIAVDWAPYQFAIDMRRTQELAIIRAIDEISNNAGRILSAVLVRGEAGVGKSTICKRVAFELQKAGQFVLWCHRQPSESASPFRDLAKAVKRAITSGALKTPPIVFCDDPWTLRVTVSDIANAFEAEGIRAIFVVVGRNTDYAVHAASLRLPFIPDEELEVSIDLDDSELASVAGFLVGLGAAQTEKEAKQRVSDIRSANARDVLCSFWYLLPETRRALRDSVEDEYFRLGGGDLVAGALATAVAETSSMARRAYEYVAVTSELGIGLPIEVLVRALGMNYSDWLDLCQAGKPLWGLLYPDENKELETIVYFTRNEVVTDILLGRLNGNIGHAGEYRALRDLVGACDTGTPAYREFLTDILAKRQKLLAEKFSAREGRELFEIALATFPSPDRTIAHHFGRWITDIERDPTAGYEQFRKALETSEYSFAHQEERLEHIHTSMAAAVVKRVQRKLQDRESGLELVKRHLREASSPSFFNLHSVHVQANSLLALQEGDDQVSLESFAEAARAIERALQLAGSRLRGAARYQRDMEIMDDLKRRLIESLPSFEKIQELALESYRGTKNQLFIEAAARKGLLEAAMSDKGTHYNGVSQFIKKCALIVAKNDQPLDANVRRVRVDLTVRWRIQHLQGQVDWSEFLGDLLAIQESPGHRDDSLILFYTGIAYFQIEQTTDAHAAFARLRSVALPSYLSNSVRAYLRDDQGRPKALQGTLVGARDRAYVRCGELSTDVHIRQFRPPSDLRPGATVHFWMAFSLNGPIAAFLPPTEEDLLLL